MRLPVPGRLCAREFACRGVCLPGSLRAGTREGGPPATAKADGRRRQAASVTRPIAIAIVAARKIHGSCQEGPAAEIGPIRSLYGLISRDHRVNQPGMTRPTEVRPIMNKTGEPRTQASKLTYVAINVS